MKPAPIAFVLLLALGGCASPGYYLQAMNGQLELWRLAQPIESIQASSDQSPDLKRKLAKVLEIRDFASHKLGLPDNQSYRSYADLKRPYVVWNVFVAEEFSVKGTEWCFPIAGCVSYRGYFNKADAEEFAQSMREAGYETYVGGVPAYSTLGWFNDSVLNTFINYPEYELARLVFHELAHQVVYAGGDSEFNESFAVSVEEAGVERWLASRGDRHSQELIERGRRYRRDFTTLLTKYRKHLKELYASSDDAAFKRAEKRRIQRELKDEYEALKAGPWEGFKGYDAWFAEGINNAKLASVGIYTALVPGFRVLLSQQHGDMARFYREAQRLADLPKEVRHQTLMALGGSAEQKTASR